MTARRPCKGVDSGVGSSVGPVTGSSSELGVSVELAVGRAERGVYETDAPGAQADKIKRMIEKRLKPMGSRKLRSIFYLPSDVSPRK